ncbi:MAG: cyclophilin-like fold protein [Aigarchaeota archaeon]|nr:cyclophilin-like fold protein [Aigarchaeota archaeon]
MTFEPRIALRILAEGAPEIKGEFVRVFAPVTVDHLVKRLPLEGMAGKWGSAVYFETAVKRGAEKPVRRMKAGEIGYWPPQSAICLYHKDQAPPAQMVKVGLMLDDPSPLGNVRPGGRVRLLRA